MPRLMVPILALALGVGAAFALVSCGGASDEGLIPGNSASTIVENIDRAQSALDEGDCDQVIAYANSIRSQIDDLPTAVNPDLRSNLKKGANKLLNLASGDNCGLETESTTTTTTEESTVDTSDTTTSESTTTKETTKSTPTKETTATTPTTPTTTPTTPTTPPTTPTTPTPPGGGVGPGAPAGKGGNG